MPSTAPPAFRKILADRLSEFSRQLEESAATVAAEASETARRETADFLNQGVRRMRQASGAGELASALLDSTARFALCAALFRIDGGSAKGESVRGIEAEAESAFGTLDIPLADAPALAAAVESLDPVVSVTAPEELSAALSGYCGNDPHGRAYLFPLSPRGRAAALLCAWGDVEPSALELLAQTASAVWSAFSQSAPGLVVIDAPADRPAAEPDSAWDSLTPEERNLHLRAQRFARVRAAEILLAHGAEVRAGRERGSVYEAVREAIDGAREAFRASYVAPCPSMVDYLHLELVRTLADDDPDLLGEAYPGILA